MLCACVCADWCVYLANGKFSHFLHLYAFCEESNDLRTMWFKFSVRLLAEHLSMGKIQHEICAQWRTEQVVLICHSFQHNVRHFSSALFRNQQKVIRFAVGARWKEKNLIFHAQRTRCGNSQPISSFQSTRTHAHAHALDQPHNRINREFAVCQIEIPCQSIYTVSVSKEMRWKFNNGISNKWSVNNNFVTEYVVGRKWACAPSPSPVKCPAHGFMVKR